MISIYFRDDAVFFSFFFRLSTLGSIITKQGFGAIFGVFSTKCFKFYLVLYQIKEEKQDTHIHSLTKQWSIQVGCRLYARLLLAKQKCVIGK
jgi:hypothetical protein